MLHSKYKAAEPVMTKGITERTEDCATARLTHRWSVFTAGVSDSSSASMRNTFKLRFSGDTVKNELVPAERRSATPNVPVQPGPTSARTD